MGVRCANARGSSLSDPMVAAFRRRLAVSRAQASARAAAASTIRAMAPPSTGKGTAWTRYNIRTAAMPGAAAEKNANR